MAENKTEVWLRGPLPGVPALLQPVAHALLQVREELTVLMADFPEELLWEKPAGLASPGFHLQHLTGVLNRLLTYAKGYTLSSEQLAYLAAEGKPQDGIHNIKGLIEAFNNEVDRVLLNLQVIDPDTLTEFRGVGRAQLPSTVMGLLFHAAEHTTRHYGQLMVTVKVLQNGGI